MLVILLVKWMLYTEPELSQESFFRSFVVSKSWRKKDSEDQIKAKTTDPPRNHIRKIQHVNPTQHILAISTTICVQSTIGSMMQFLD